MGLGISQLLTAHNYDIITNVTDRSAATQERAKAASIQLLPSDAALVKQADYILSIVPPRDAVATAKRVVSALHGGDFDAFSSSLGNDLAGVTRSLVPEVGELERALLEAGALGAVMSGSGTAVCGIFRSKEEARRAGKSLRVPLAEVCEPARLGVEMS